MSLLPAGVVLLSAGAALAATQVNGGHYAGITRQGRTITFDVSSAGTQVDQPSFYLRTGCGRRGHSFAETSSHATATASGAIEKGKFVLRFTERQLFAHHLKATAHFTLRGQFKPDKRAVGSVSVTVGYSSGARCASGDVRFKAHAEPSPMTGSRA